MNTPELAVLLDQRLPPPRRELLHRVSGAAEAAGLPLYLVGGFVRDLLLGLPPGDFDFVVEGPAPDLVRALARELGGEVTVHADFGTATWLGPDGAALDFTTSRTETYPQPAALPRVRPASISDDLGRRDFTINALAVRVDGERLGELLDPHGGRADLEARLVRVLHPRSFQDDPTRLFRAVRYARRLEFALEPETARLIPGAWEALAALTGDRVRREFELLFREPRAVAMLEQLAALDIPGHVHPALGWGASASERAQAIARLPFAEWKLDAPPEPDALYFALMLEAAADEEVAEALIRLNVNRVVFEAVRQAVGLDPAWSRPSEVAAALDDLSELAVIAVYVLHPAARAEVHAYLSRWRFVRPATTGDDLIGLGLRPGPPFKRILWELRAARLDGEVSDAAGEQALLMQLVAETQKH
jgi:tRNA nucleotidyltransferase (CCA-adding enzyme)